MSSPRVSVDSDDPVHERKESGFESSRAPNRRISYADEPRRRSIQFNVGGSNSQQHRRSASDKGPDKGPSPSEKRRSHVEFREKEPKVTSNAASRGPSPPPPE